MESGTHTTHIAFSSDGRYAALALEKGSYIYDLELSQLKYGPIPDLGGEGCGLIATESGKFWMCTGNDSSPGNSSRLARVCEASDGGTILAYRVTPTPILAVRVFKPSHLPDEEALCIIVTESTIYIYDAGFETCRSMIDTEPNPNGAIAVSQQEPLRIAYPVASVGGIRVATLNGESYLVGAGKFAEHLRLITFSPSGKCLAATDHHGVQVSVFTLPTAGQTEPEVQTYHRGRNYCVMTSLSFNADHENILCCSSDHGTVHIFDVTPSQSLFPRAIWKSSNWNVQIKPDVEGKTWCFFSKDSSRLHRVSATNVSVFSVDLKLQNPEPKLLFSRDILPLNA